MRKTSAGAGPESGKHFHQPRILQSLSVDQQTGYFVCPSRHVNHSPSGNAPSYQQKSKIGFVSRLIRRKQCIEDESESQDGGLYLAVVGCWLGLVFAAAAAGGSCSLLDDKNHNVLNLFII